MKAKKKMQTPKTINELRTEDYTEPRCLLDMNQGLPDRPARSIPVGRIVEKLDEYLSRDDWAGAGRHLDYWLADARACGDKKGELALQGERMGYFRKQGREEEAIDAAGKALALVEALGMGESITAATTYINIATVYKTFGRSSESLPFFEKARPIYEKNLAPDDGRLGGLYNNLGLALADLGRFEEAESFFEKALRVMEKVPNGELEQAITKLNLADLYAARSGYEAAEETIQDLLDEGRRLLDTASLPRNGYYAYVVKSCAPTFRTYGRFADADELEEIAAALYRQAQPDLNDRQDSK